MLELIAYIITAIISILATLAVTRWQWVIRKLKQYRHFLEEHSETVDTIIKAVEDGKLTGDEVRGVTREFKEDFEAVKKLVKK